LRGPLDVESQREVVVVERADDLERLPGLLLGRVPRFAVMMR